MKKQKINPDQYDLFADMVNREVLPIDVVQTSGAVKSPVSFAIENVLASVTKQMQDVVPKDTKEN